MCQILDRGKKVKFITFLQIIIREQAIITYPLLLIFTLLDYLTTFIGLTFLKNCAEEQNIIMLSLINSYGFFLAFLLHFIFFFSISSIILIYFVYLNEEKLSLIKKSKAYGLFLFSFFSAYLLLLSFWISVFFAVINNIIVLFGCL